VMALVPKLSWKKLMEGMIFSKLRNAFVIAFRAMAIGR
jgi:hypothetical protein